MSWPWNELGLDGPASMEEVRRAYAQRVKEVHPEEDPEGFQRLHTAYQQARQIARQTRREELTAQQQEQRERRNGTETLRQEQDVEKAPDTQESNWDFDALIGQEETPEKAAEETGRETTQEPSWDFQRIFHEENTQQTERKKSGRGEDVSVYQALELVEILFDEERPYQDWQRFLTSVVFFRVKWNPRFMSALAGAFQSEPVLEQRIRQVVCDAYGFQPHRVPREHQAFYEAISGQREQTEKEKKRRFRKRHPFLFRLAVVFTILLLISAAIRLGRYIYEMPDRQMTAKLCQYMEEDIGYPVESLYDGYLTSPKLFYLPVQRVSFTAWPEGERDLSQGEPGYGTDLGNRMLTEALETFLKEWGDTYTLKRMDAEGNYLFAEDIPDIYGISTELIGETDFLTALWDKMNCLSQEDWYVLWQPTFQIQMEAWNMPYFTYQSSEGPFPGGELLFCYQQELPLKLVTYLVEESDLGELDFGNQPYHLENLGTVTLDEDVYIRVGGVDETTGETTRMYLYNITYLISMPAAEFDPNMSKTDYLWLLMGEKIPKQGDSLPWPRVGICRN